MKSIRIVTDIPGPRSREVGVRAAKVIGRPVLPGGVYIEKAQGAVVEDVDGNRFLDFIGGVGCMIVGHSHPKVVSAVDSQSRKYTHTDFSIVPYESYIKLAEELDKRCGGAAKRPFSTRVPSLSRTPSKWRGLRQVARESSASKVHSTGGPGWLSR